MKVWMAIVGSVLFLFSCGWIYIMMELHERDKPVRAAGPPLKNINEVIKGIENDFTNLEKEKDVLQTAIKNVLDTQTGRAHLADRPRQNRAAAAAAATEPVVESKVKPAKHAEQPLPPAVVESSLKFAMPGADGDVCKVTARTDFKTDVKMDQFLEKEDFADNDGGVWKQGYDISYDMSEFDKEPLHVFVVPHSHNDPGWLKTVEGYFEAQTRSILNNVVNYLSQNKDRKFIWAEMSYLSMWWNEQGDEMKNKFRQLVKDKQLEIVTGGWVMNDEANTHYFAMIDQMIEGHEWIKHNVGEDIVPHSGWAIDPFGHSPTMAYILKRMDFDFMLIQRTHYIIKKVFSRRKQLEFKWKQSWDGGDSTDMLCHMMPFYSYDVPHTCGPDPKVCCQFDFRRLPGGRVTCPWRINPVAINDMNVRERADMLLDQYRKKSRLFKTNVLLVPLGDDFRYDLAQDAENQFNNYEALMKYINSNPQLKAKVEFGTLADYTAELKKRAGVDANGLPKGFPAVGGDFFTYTDRNQDYWSGYFTSRPFYKNLDRVLESVLRASELVFSLAHAMASQQSQQVTLNSAQAFEKLIQGRRMLGLFQHHDGITGTARMDVVIDYGKKLVGAYWGLMGMMREAVAAMIQAKSAVKITLADTVGRDAHDTLEELRLVSLESAPRLVTVYNPLAKARTTIVRLRVNSGNVEVVDSNSKPVPIQVNTHWQSENELLTTVFELLIKVSVSPLGVTSLLLRKTSSPVEMARTDVYNTVLQGAGQDNVNTVQAKEFSLANSQYKLNFGSNGMLQSVYSEAEKTTTELAIGFHVYMSNVQPGHKPGAYLFFPSGSAEPHAMGTNPAVHITRGSLCNEVTVHWPQIRHTVRLYNLEGLESMAIDIENVVDISQHNQKEFIMRIVSGVKPPGAIYYSDLNGFTMQQRKYLDKLPMQGNFYPLPSMAFLDDGHRRLSVISGQPLGSASLQPGWLEVVLDRRLMQDDDRGLGQPVTDNHPTKSVFRLVLEKRAQATTTQPTVAYPTLTTNMLSELFMHTSVSFVSDATFQSKVPAPIAGASADLPCNLFMVNLRTLHRSAGADPDSKRALLLHNKAYDCQFAVPDRCISVQSRVDLKSFFAGMEVTDMENVSLSLAHSRKRLSVDTPVHVRPMEIEALKLVLK